jgi:uncharacterized protein YpbB
MVENELEITVLNDDVPKKKKDTRMVTLEMFKEGKSVQKIALERGLAKSTIEGHLEKFVASGEIGIEGLIDREKASLIAGYFQKNNASGLNEAKAALGEKVSYGELRIMKEYLQFTGEV